MQKYEILLAGTTLISNLTTVTRSKGGEGIGNNFELGKKVQYEIQLVGSTLISNSAIVKFWGRGSVKMFHHLIQVPTVQKSFENK